MTEVLERDGEAWRAWGRGERPAPEGESFAQLAQRVAVAADPLLAEPGTSLVVTHGAAIRVLVTHRLGLALGVLGGVGNASHTVLERTRRGVRLAAYNAGADGGGVR